MKFCQTEEWSILSAIISIGVEILRIFCERRLVSPHAHMRHKMYEKEDAAQSLHLIKSHFMFIHCLVTDTIDVIVVTVFRPV